jgi:hypothetical protein
MPNAMVKNGTLRCVSNTIKTKEITTHDVRTFIVFLSVGTFGTASDHLHAFVGRRWRSPKKRTVWAEVVVVIVIIVIFGGYH